MLGFVREQACSGLSETGVTDAATWEALKMAAGGDVEVPEQAAEIQGEKTVAEMEEAAERGMPVLVPGDVRREVRGLQWALLREGFSSGKDEVECMEMGERTCEALKCFHASAGLPEAGSATKETWARLLSEREVESGSDALISLAEQAEDHYNVKPDPNPSKGSVFLLGEGRYEGEL